LRQRRSDASPHTSYLFKFLKNAPGRQRSRERLSSITDLQTSSISTGPQIPTPKPPFTWKGAQYSLSFRGVNRLSRNFFCARNGTARKRVQARFTSLIFAKCRLPTETT
jgi:hypothetical protein